MNSVSREHLCLRQSLHGVTLLKDSSDADRCGILCLMLKLALQSGVTVSLFTSDYPSSHYKGILKKLGVNLDRCPGTLECTDVLQHLDVWDPDQTLQQLRKLTQDVEAAGRTNHLVVFDSLSYIASALAESCRRIVQFTQALTTMAVCSKQPCSLLMVAHDDIPKHTKWLTLLEHSVDTVLTLEALPVGQAADVQMRVFVFRPNRWGRAMDPDTPPDTCVQLHEEMFASVSERSITLRQAAQ
eukprot:jgi/Ulvmu1/5335/UM022_0129.1